MRKKILHIHGLRHFHFLYFVSYFWLILDRLGRYSLQCTMGSFFHFGFLPLRIISTYAFVNLVAQAKKALLKIDKKYNKGNNQWLLNAKIVSEKK